MATAQLNPAPTAVRVPQKKVSRNVNPLLLPTETGKARPSTYALPPQEHVYGKEMGRDPEGAKEVVGFWKEHQKNADSQPGRDFKALNKNSVRAGNVTAKETMEYRKCHDFRLKMGGHDEPQGQGAAGSKAAAPVDVNTDFAYGLKTRPGTPMEVVLTNTFQNEFLAKQADINSMAREEQRSIPVLHTKASMGHARRPELAPQVQGPAAAAASL